MIVVIYSINQDYEDIYIDGGFSRILCTEFVNVDASVYFDDGTQVRSEYKFKSSDFEYDFKSAEERIKAMYK